MRPFGRLFAKAYDAGNRLAERGWLGQERTALLAGLSGLVLEVGAGTGANILRYPPDVRLIATEPDPAMLAEARPRAVTRGDGTALVLADAQRLPFPDATFDAVVATLVFCTVRDPLQGLREVRRVAKPGAPVLLLEHVASKRKGVRRLQDFLNPAQRVIGGGCNLNRETAEVARQAGLVDVTEEPARTMMGIMPFVRIRARA